MVRGGQVEVSVRRLDNSMIEIAIEDNGTGMSPEFINNDLFVPFESTKGVSGMGVGVYQSREYIRSIDGDIEVTSELGTGTRFKMFLPVEDE